MALPTVFVEAIKTVPTKDLDKLCSMFKFEYKGSKITSRTLVELFEKGDRAAIELLYKGIAPILLVGGMVPGVGLACNIIDAAFCYSIGAWLDFSIDVIAIALFEVPGVSGLKGVSKGLMGLCRSIKIDAKAFWKILDKIHQCNILKESKVHQLFSILMAPSNSFIRFVDIKAIAQSIPNLNNPFIKWGKNILVKVSSECEACGVKTIEKAYSTMKIPTKVTNHNVTKFGVLSRGRFLN